MSSPSARAIRMIDNKKLGQALTNLDTNTAFQGIVKVNRAASRPDTREYIKELIVSSATNLGHGHVVRSEIDSALFMVIALDPINAHQETAVRVATILRMNSSVTILEFWPPTQDEWGGQGSSAFSDVGVNGVYGTVFSKLPGSRQEAYGARPDAVISVTVSRTIASTYVPKMGDRVVTTDLADGFMRTWQVDLVDHDFHGPNAFVLSVSEDHR